MTKPHAELYIQKSQSPQHDLIKGWHLGKALQSCNGKSETLRQKFFELQKSKQTSLSKSVYNTLLHFDSIDISNCNVEKFVTQDFLLNWDELTIEKLINGADVTKMSEVGMFQVAGKNIKIVAKVVHEKYFKHLTQDQFRMRYKNFFTIIKQRPELFEIAFKYYIMQNESWFAFLLLVPFIENGLQNVYYAYKLKHLPKGAPPVFEIPKKLSDLLAEKEISEMFGKDVTFLIRLLVGPLHSVNLRNVSIHGFISQEEWYPGWTSLVMMLMLSLGPLILKIRKQFSLPDVIRPIEKVDSDLGYGTENIFRTKEINNEKEIYKVLNRSLFVLPLWRNDWIRAIQEFFAGNYYFSIIRMFVLFEHAIRRIYVCVNNFAHKLLTAENTTAYTTLNVLLGDFILDGDNKKKQNLIHNELGLVYQNALYDWFIWDTAPRVRDIVFHGACDSLSLSKHLAERVLALGLALCVKYDVENTPTTEYFESLPSIFRESVHYYENVYEPLFHPKNQLRKTIFNCEKELDSFNDFIVLQSKQEQPPGGKDQHINMKQLSCIESFIEQEVKKMKSKLPLKGKLSETKNFFTVVLSQQESKRV